VRPNDSIALRFIEDLEIRMSEIFEYDIDALDSEGEMGMMFSIFL
jgi:hypothetical protein